MEIAVTGATGHIGGVLVRALIQRGDRVRALVHDGDSATLDGLDVERVRGDVVDGAALDTLFRGKEIVFHLASRIWLGGWEPPAVARTNIDGTLAVLAAARRQGVRRVVYFSSIHAIASREGEEVIDETSPLVDDPRAPIYDRTKSQAQRHVVTAAANGLDTVIVNPTGVIGPFDFRVSRMGRTFLDLYLGRLPALPASGFNWVDVRDVVDGALAAAERGVRGEHYLLGGHWHTIRALAGMTHAIDGRPPPRFDTPMWIVRGAGIVAGQFSRALGREGHVTRDSVRALEGHRRISHAKAAEVLGYRPRPTEDSVRDVVAWFRANGGLP